MAAPTKRHIGRSALLDDDPEAFQLGHLIPNGKGPTSDPLTVRVVTTATGWRGYVVDAPVSQGQCEWSRDHWTWEAAPETAAETAGESAPAPARPGQMSHSVNGVASSGAVPA